MSFLGFDATCRTRKRNFLNKVDYLIDWSLIEQAIAQHYTPATDAIGRYAYPGLLLFKMFLVGIGMVASVMKRLKTWLTQICT